MRFPSPWGSVIKCRIPIIEPRRIALIWNLQVLIAERILTSCRWINGPRWTDPSPSVPVSATPIPAPPVSAPTSSTKVQTAIGRAPCIVGCTIGSIRETPFFVRLNRPAKFFHEIVMVHATAELQTAASIPIAAALVIALILDVERADRRILLHSLTRCVVRVERSSRQPVCTDGFFSYLERAHPQNDQSESRHVATVYSNEPGKVTWELFAKKLPTFQ